ncbi:hypothetical protein D4W73_10170 [Listeria monocytogenes]|nr:hypothetical protein [Listeria monocytogenes]
MIIKLDKGSYYSQQELLKQLSIGYETLRKLEIKGELSTRKLGKTIYYQGADVLDSWDRMLKR